MILLFTYDNICRVIVYLEVRELRSLYAYIDIFVKFLMRVFFCTWSYQIQKILNKSIWSIDGTLTGNTTPGLSEHGINGHEGLLNIP